MQFYTLTSSTFRGLLDMGSGMSEAIVNLASPAEAVGEVCHHHIKHLIVTCGSSVTWHSWCNSLHAVFDRFCTHKTRFANLSRHTMFHILIQVARRKFCFLASSISHE